MTRAVVVALALASAVSADDWPQWLGPSRDGHARPGALRAGATPKLAVAWRKALGSGSASVVVGGGRAYTTFSDGEADHAVALRLADGFEVWRTQLDAAPSDEGGPGSTPLLHRGHLVTLSRACRLRALDAATGAVVWTRDLAADFAVKLARGCTTSPLVEGGRLVVQAGGRDNATLLAALDPATGVTLSTVAGTHRVTYTSPVAAEVGGVRQLVLHTTLAGPPPLSGLVGLRPQDGTVEWAAQLEKGFSFETPLVLPDGHVVLSTWSDTQSFRVTRQDGRLTATPSWRTDDLTALVNPPVLVGGHLYGLGGDFLACLDPATGRTVWKEKVYPGSITAADDTLVVLSIRAGLLRLIDATPAGHREKARLEVFQPGSSAGAPPTVVPGLVLVRNDEEVVAVRVD